MTEFMSVKLVQCPACSEPLVVSNGTIQSGVTFFMRDGERCATSHTEDCQFRGSETPRPQDWGTLGWPL